MASYLLKIANVFYPMLIGDPLKVTHQNFTKIVGIEKRDILCYHVGPMRGKKFSHLHRTSDCYRQTGPRYRLVIEHQ